MGEVNNNFRNDIYILFYSGKKIYLILQYMRVEWIFECYVIEMSK